MGLNWPTYWPFTLKRDRPAFLRTFLDNLRDAGGVEDVSWLLWTVHHQVQTPALSPAGAVTHQALHRRQRRGHGAPRVSQEACSEQCSVRLCAASLCQSYLELMLLHTLTGSSFLQSCASLLSSTWWPFWFLFWDLICVEGLMISEDCDDSWHTGRYHSWHSWQLKLWSCYCQVSSEQSGVN